MNQKRDDALVKALEFEPPSEAQRISGKSYEEDEDTEWLGLALHMAKGEHVHGMLSATGDTTFSMGWEPYRAVLRAEGFNLALSEQFQRQRHADEPQRTDTYEIWWHDDGLLLACDSYGWAHEPGELERNSATVYYNWRPRTVDYPHVTSSGRYVEWDDTDPSRRLWSGDSDAREALRLKLRRLREFGSFVKPWVEPPYHTLGAGLWDDSEFWRDASWEAKDERCDTSTRAVYERLPEAVRAFARPYEWSKR